MLVKFFARKAAWLMFTQLYAVISQSQNDKEIEKHILWMGHLVLVVKSGRCQPCSTFLKRSCFRENEHGARHQARLFYGLAHIRLGEGFPWKWSHESERRWAVCPVGWDVGTDVFQCVRSLESSSDSCAIEETKLKRERGRKFKQQWYSGNSRKQPPDQNCDWFLHPSNCY